MLPDGRYDVFVVDATPVAGGGDGAFRLELAIIAGGHKGEVVAVAATGLATNEIDLVGVPATLVVADGRPTVTLD